MFSFDNLSKESRQGSGCNAAAVFNFARMRARYRRQKPAGNIFIALIKSVVLLRWPLCQNLNSEKWDAICLNGNIFGRKASADPLFFSHNEVCYLHPETNEENMKIASEEYVGKQTDKRARQWKRRGLLGLRPN